MNTVQPDTAARSRQLHPARENPAGRAAHMCASGVSEGSSRGVPGRKRRRKPTSGFAQMLLPGTAAERHTVRERPRGSPGPPDVRTVRSPLAQPLPGAWEKHHTARKMSRDGHSPPDVRTVRSPLAQPLPGAWEKRHTARRRPQDSPRLPDAPGQSFAQVLPPEGGARSLQSAPPGERTGNIPGPVRLGTDPERTEPTVG